MHCVSPEQLARLAALSRALHAVCSSALLHAGLPRTFHAIRTDPSRCVPPRVGRGLPALRTIAHPQGRVADADPRMRRLHHGGHRPVVRGQGVSVLADRLPRMLVTGYNRRRREQVYYGLLREDDLERWSAELESCSRPTKAMMAALSEQRDALDTIRDRFGWLAEDAPRPRVTPAEKQAGLRDAERQFRALWPPEVADHLAGGGASNKLRHDVSSLAC
ncbi:hypothetical protein DFJ73DRAFT_760202 [Zopfochytrium polystomum]|nr:hypothetical protein DFJ73DRAFT_760202 [Zopfochytrium polystomum]